MLERFSRQLATGKITSEGQKALSKKKIAIIGLGATGSPLAVLLLRAGARNITIVDRDFVDITNLQRQSYIESDIGKAKPEALKKHLLDIDSRAKIDALSADIDKDTISCLESCDLILDGTDNMETRFLINDFCHKHKIPWIYAAAIGTTCASMSIIPGKTACFECVFEKESPAGTLETCETAGILNSTSNHLSAHVAVEAIKLLTGKKPEEGLYYYDVWSHSITKSDVKRRNGCGSCGGKYSHLDKRKTESASLCGSDSYHIKPNRPASIDLESLENRLKKTAIVEKRGSVLHILLGGKKIALFRDGRAIIKNAKTLEQAKAVYAKVVSV